MSFVDEIEQYDGKQVREQILAKTPQDVERALAMERLRIDDFMALLSPAAQDYLEPMAQRSHELTKQRFGNNILMYAPLYISNECSNGCVYCGFNAGNKVQRKTLSLDEVEEDARVLYEQGFRHILLLTGESPKAIGNDYLAAAVERIRSMFSSISIEVYPMDTEGYRQMVGAGVDGLTIYQETYDRELYNEIHLYGKKKDYNWRLTTPERGCQAGLRRVGIGALMGLGEFYSETFFTGLHAHYLSRHYWRTQISVSFPRMRPADGGYAPRTIVDDRQFVQALCAMRLLLPDSGLILSTRESAELRNNLIPLGITQMSAGSCTAPGGYAHGEDSSEQFVIDDSRSPEEVARQIRDTGYEVVWKDWDNAFLNKAAGA